ncbi:S41 family peptidase [Sunxiuqinia elliptica]|uniref:Carboxyl-terminal processing protease n=1 Tax=Sunxiuqinia elliptica TaxID=655355 RepID=A0A4V6PRU7_9BACT|nr:S41 family peptidase [Sunxiuqinia elliptica]TDO02829.1 carboxyl-terminal processing protease [Sunxiuqinia elliptica]TDO58432.1 carboxyl-terminal processing protease [Sunxiuqinia elliptica]
MNRKQIAIYLPILIAVSVIVGIVLGNSLSRIQTPALQNFSPPKVNKLSAIVDLINHAYVDSVETDELVEKTIPELLKNLDPHTAYIPARDMQEVHEEMQGNFGGIGVQFSIHNDTVQVVDVVSGGPSYKLGILPGDRIVTVNDSVIAGVDVENEDVLSILRGEKGTIVKVGIKRKGIADLILYEITRGDIPIYSIDVSYMIDETTGFVKVNRFAEKTYDEFINAISKLNKAGAEKFIVDLRGNPGGYLMAVVSMVNEFLPEGNLIVYTEGNSQPRKTYSATKSGIALDKDVIVLIDEYSASASEIFAGAIQDNDRGIVVGRRSFGKGLVQEQIPFNDGSALRLTVARYYTPSGRSIQKSYVDGNMSYYHDIIDRAEHGEFQVADSIQFADSLKYETAHGRIVYGGGGIMPDYFVPADTAGYSAYYSKITQKALVYHFAFEYTDENRDQLSGFGTANELADYLNQQDILRQFVAYANKEGVKEDAKGLATSGKIIETQVKAYIARNMIGEEGFFPIIREIDETLKEAIRLSNSKKQFSQLIAVTK